MVQIKKDQGTMPQVPVRPGGVKYGFVINVFTSLNFIRRLS